MYHYKFLSRNTVSSVNINVQQEEGACAIINFCPAVLAWGDNAVSELNQLPLCLSCLPCTVSCSYGFALVLSSHSRWLTFPVCCSFNCQIWIWALTICSTFFPLFSPHRSLPGLWAWPAMFSVWPAKATLTPVATHCSATRLASWWTTWSKDYQWVFVSVPSVLAGC